MIGASRRQTGFLDRVLNTEGHRYRYQIYEPNDYTPRRIPLPRLELESGISRSGYFMGMRTPRSTSPVAATGSGLERAGAPVRYTEYPGVDHLAVTSKAYADPALFKWLFSQSSGRPRGSTTRR